MILTVLKDEKAVTKLDEAYAEILANGNMPEFIAMTQHPSNLNKSEWSVIKQALKLEKQS